MRRDFLILTMAVFKEKYLAIKKELDEKSVTLVAVSKIRTAREIKELYDLGHRDFGENYVQELVEKQKLLPQDIRWHFIGHLQKNKIKFIAPFIHLVQGVDSLKLLEAIQKQGAKEGRVIDCLLQVHIAREETKFGFSSEELDQLLKVDLASMPNVRVKGMMGMASFSDDQEQVKMEFKTLREIFEKFKAGQSSSYFQVLSMGMSADYRLAIGEGSNMVRIGSMLFGERR